jgi:hypothetical protein
MLVEEEQPLATSGSARRWEVHAVKFALGRCTESAVWKVMREGSLLCTHLIGVITV